MIRFIYCLYKGGTLYYVHHHKYRGQPQPSPTLAAVITNLLAVLVAVAVSVLLRCHFIIRSPSQVFKRCYYLRFFMRWYQSQSAAILQKSVYQQVVHLHEEPLPLLRAAEELATYQ